MEPGPFVEWNSAAVRLHRQRRREEDEDQETRDEDHRDDPRQNGDEVAERAEVGFHGTLTRRQGLMLREVGPFLDRTFVL